MVMKLTKALSYSGGMLGGGVIGVLNIFIITMMFYSVVEYIPAL